MTKSLGNILLQYCDEKFSKTPNKIDTKDLDDLIKIAEKNKLSFVLSKNLIKEKGFASEKILKNVIDRGRKNVEIFNKTIRFVDDIMKENGIDYLLIKTYKILPYITKDIDILVKKDDLNDAKKIITENGGRDYEFSKSNQFIFRILHKTEDTFGGKGLLIDVYHDFSWIRIPCMDESFLWKNKRKIDINSIKTFIPSIEADMLTFFAHSIFWHGYIPLLDYIYLQRLLDKRPNIKLMEREIENYGWKNGFKWLISFLRKSYHEAVTRDKELQLPILIPMNIINNSYKGYVQNSANRLRGIDKLLVFGDIGFHSYFLLKERKWIK